jgi:hypothetical protein
MKALSLWQPWATLIAVGEKEYETRSWTPRGLRDGDLLAIHAAKKFTKEDIKLCYTEPFLSTLRAHGVQVVTSPQLPKGAMLCICQLVSVTKTEVLKGQLSPLERAFGNYGNNRYAWRLKVLTVFDEPIPVSGAQSLWEWTMPAGIVLNKCSVCDRGYVKDDGDTCLECQHRGQTRSFRGDPERWIYNPLLYAEEFRNANKKRD